jgi:hypothetical protein
MSHRRHCVSLALAVLIAALLALPGAVSAAVPGDNCQVHGGAPEPGWTVVTDSGPWYYLNWPQYFHIEAYGSSETYYGHGNGMSRGYIVRAAINQATCA